MIRGIQVISNGEIKAINKIHLINIALDHRGINNITFMAILKNKISKAIHGIQEKRFCMNSIGSNKLIL
jgi:hypothetical protein